LVHDAFDPLAAFHVHQLHLEAVRAPGPPSDQYLNRSLDNVPSSMRILAELDRTPESLPRHFPAPVVPFGGLSAPLLDLTCRGWRLFAVIDIQDRRRSIISKSGRAVIASASA
jgi:hypothetical protein